jgi:hypothetical protein
MRTYDPYQLITQTRTLLGTVPGAGDDEQPVSRWCTCPGPGSRGRRRPGTGR